MPTSEAKRRFAPSNWRMIKEQMNAQAGRMREGRQRYKTGENREKSGATRRLKRSRKQEGCRQDDALKSSRAPIETRLKSGLE